MDQVNQDNLTYAEWSEINRVVFIIHGDQHWFAGIWKMVQEFDGAIMRLSGTPDWPHGAYDSVEVHKILPNERPDRYSVDNRIWAFKFVMAIRPVKEDPTTHREGSKVIIRLPEKAQITTLQLSKPI